MEWSEDLREPLLKSADVSFWKTWAAQGAQRTGHTGVYTVIERMNSYGKFVGVFPAAKGCFCHIAGEIL